VELVALIAIVAASIGLALAGSGAILWVALFLMSRSSEPVTLAPVETSNEFARETPFRLASPTT
jgi:hypothetical protein